MNLFDQESELFSLYEIFFLVSSIVNTYCMNDEGISGLFYRNFSGPPDDFIELSCEDSDGSLLHGSAKRVAEDHYEVLVKEKQVIIHCTKDAEGNLSCQLSRHGNPEWVNRISKELTKSLEK